MKSTLPRFTRLLTRYSMAVVMLLCLSTPTSAQADKRLIELGWDTPSLQEMPTYLDAAQRTPFDGVVLDVDIPHDSRGLGWTIFGKEQVDGNFLEALGAAYSNLEWGRLTDNFLRVTVSPGNIDWFDSFQSVQYNFQAVAQLARTLGFRGIMLDTEQYGENILFTYPRQLYKNLHNYDEYHTQAYRRGRQIMRAMNAGYPGITVLLTYGTSLAAQRGSEFDGSRHGYGLMVPFVDGLIAGADENTTLHDVFEGAYHFKRESEFRDAYLLIHQKSLQFARNPRLYSQKVQAGFGLWLDHACTRNQGLQPGGCSGGYTPANIGPVVDVAMQYSDRYVWIYSQSISWYTGANIPTDWQQALYSLGQ
ncbi:MAG: hypothetical protein K8L99_13645 [Anaerolineae bacterium]|nr:hypothetical protein [Anaerolineae bacterium]